MLQDSGTETRNISKHKWDKNQDSSLLKFHSSWCCGSMWFSWISSVRFGQTVSILIEFCHSTTSTISLTLEPIYWFLRMQTLTLCTPIVQQMLSQTISLKTVFRAPIYKNAEKDTAKIAFQHLKSSIEWTRIAPLHVTTKKKPVRIYSNRCHWRVLAQKHILHLHQSCWNMLGRVCPVNLSSISMRFQYWRVDQGHIPEIRFQPFFPGVPERPVARYCCSRFTFEVSSRLSPLYILGFSANWSEKPLFYYAIDCEKLNPVIIPKWDIHAFMDFVGLWTQQW